MAARVDLIDIKVGFVAAMLELADTRVDSVVEKMSLLIQRLLKLLQRLPLLLQRFPLIL